MELHQVTRLYGAGNIGVAALDDVSLSCPAGTWTAIMGPSGSGKSTLLHCAAGLDQVTGGRVLLAGHDITRAHDSRLTELRRRTIGFVFQNFNLISSLTAEQNVGFPSKLAGVRVSRKDVRQTLASVGLADRASHKPRELLVVVAIGSVAIVAVTSGVTAAIATRQRPVSLATTGE